MEMNSEDLIATLAQDVRPLRRHALARRLLAGLLAGGVATALIVGCALGFRPDLWLAMHGSPFWVKWIYTASLALCATRATASLARPDTPRMGWMWIMVARAGACGDQHGRTGRGAPAQWLAMWLGGAGKSAPVWFCCFRCRSLAGCCGRSAACAHAAAAGRSNCGPERRGLGATLYCLHCPEVSAIFVLTWYSLGIALASLLGAALGPRLLRW
jgi:hypothetical protein